MTSSPRFPRRGRLLNRLLLAIVTAGLTAGAIGALLLQRTAHDAALDEASDRAQLVAAQYAVRIDSRIGSLLDVLRLASTRQELTDLGAAAADELRVVLRATPSVDELVLIGGDGTPLAAAASRFLPDPADYADRPELLTEVAAHDHVALRDGDPIALELAVPVENPPGQVVGALLAIARLEEVAAPLEETLRDGDPVPFLVSPGGEVLIHRDRSRVGDDRFPIDRLYAAGGRDRFELDGQVRLFASARSEQLGAEAVVEQPESVALAPVADRRDELLVILLAVTGATVVAVAVAGDILLRPLRPLAAAVSRVGHGERGVRTGIRSRSEVGVLAAAVDRMAESLDRRDEQISELRELSLLVGTLADQRAVAIRIADGATKLVRADAAAVLGAATGEVLGATGAYAEGTPASQLDVPLVGSDETDLGTLRALRADPPFEEDECALLTAFAAFAAVALDNARRLGLEHQLIDQLQAAVDQRRDLIGTITHEFRTPLACIEGFTTELLDGWADYSEDERRGLVARIGHNGEELDELVGRFLDFTVTERGGMTARIEVLALEEIIEQTLASLAPLLADRRMDVQVTPTSIAADRVLLRRTLTNLLSNAVKYSAPGSAIALRAVATGSVARVEVVDEGVGLRADEVTRAFDPFWRGGPATTRSTRGAGLGLALVAEYVRAMGGTVWVESAPGAGSTFAFTVPLATVADVHMADGAGG